MVTSDQSQTSEIAGQHGQFLTKHKEPSEVEIEQDDQSIHLSTSLSNHDAAPSRCGPHDGALERTPTAEDKATTAEARPTLTTASSAAPLHSVFTKNQKRFIVFMASWGGFFSAVSSNIYFPALNSLAIDLRVSKSLINLTLTSYMVSLSHITSTHRPKTDSNISDLPRPCPSLHRRAGRHGWPASSLLLLLRRIHRRVRRFGTTEQLHRALPATMPPEHGEQRHDRPLQRRGR